LIVLVEEAHRGIVLSPYYHIFQDEVLFSSSPKNPIPDSPTIISLFPILTYLLLPDASIDYDVHPPELNLDWENSDNTLDNALAVNLSHTSSSGAIPQEGNGNLVEHSDDSFAV
jgi:hypothetical protein